MWIWYVQEFCMVYWWGRLAHNLRQWFYHSFCGLGLLCFQPVWRGSSGIYWFLEYNCQNGCYFRGHFLQDSGRNVALGFNYFSSFSTPLTVIWIGGICGDRFWLGSLVRFSLVNRYWNLFERISALDLLSVWRMPLSFSGEIPVESLLSDFM